MLNKEEVSQVKRKILLWLSLLSLLFLVSCSNETTKKEKKATDPESALMYTFSIDQHDYRFRLLDGWIKYPNEDDSIAFLVGNKDIKSFMTAGFEENHSSLDAYKDSFMKKLEEGQAIILEEPKKERINKLDCYTLSFTMKDAKDRPLTYKTHLIETKDYFVNLAAWTSQEKPSKEVLDELETMLGTFELLK